ncbi:MAG: hypothetical protein O2858_08590 [Proteobacteria bacterium]|nr:hypothetical protein [Pseudomonadota bacterium]
MAKRQRLGGTGNFIFNQQRSAPPELPHLTLSTQHFGMTYTGYWS